MATWSSTKASRSRKRNHSPWRPREARATTPGGQIVTGDSTMFSDLAIVVGGNQQLLNDGMNWLTRNETLSGTTENEEDIQIQHTKEGQAGWFYATVLGFPAIIFVFGLVRTRRRKGGEA